MYESEEQRKYAAKPDLAHVYTDTIAHTLAPLPDLGPDFACSRHHALESHSLDLWTGKS